MSEVPTESPINPNSPSNINGDDKTLNSTTAVAEKNQQSSHEDTTTAKGGVDDTKSPSSWVKFEDEQSSDNYQAANNSKSEQVSNELGIVDQIRPNFFA